MGQSSSRLWEVCLLTRLVALLMLAPQNVVKLSVYPETVVLGSPESSEQLVVIATDLHGQPPMLRGGSLLPSLRQATHR